MADIVNVPVGLATMNCQNCGHSDSFVLLFDLAACVTAVESTSLDWSFCVQCPECGSTDVEGNPAQLFDRLQDSTAPS